MSDPTPVLARDIHFAAEAAILAIVTDGKKSANFQGRSYTVQDVDGLRKLSETYRRLAINRGEIIPGRNEGPVGVSRALITDRPFYQ